MCIYIYIATREHISDRSLLNHDHTWPYNIRPHARSLKGGGKGEDARKNTFISLKVFPRKKSREPLEEPEGRPMRPGDHLVFLPFFCPPGFHSGSSLDSLELSSKRYFPSTSAGTIVLRFFGSPDLPCGLFFWLFLVFFVLCFCSSSCIPSGSSWNP